MTRRAALAMTGLMLCLCPRAHAHRLDEYLQATLISLDGGRITASLRMVPGVAVAPAVIAAIDTDHDGAVSANEARAYADRVLADLSLTVDGRPLAPRLVSWSVPAPAELRDGLGELHLVYTAALPPTGGEHVLAMTDRHRIASSVYLVNTEEPTDPHLSITAQKRNASQTDYELHYLQTGTAPRHTSVAGVRGWFANGEFAGLFHLGMHHIAEGTDHLLFLLALLLPAPLLARNARWRGTADLSRSLLHVLGIVTAFTIGHSVTLTLAALGAVHVPARPVEVLIAVSIFVSALHALRPLLPGREAWIAGGFGLVHGLAFAATLDRLALDRWGRAVGILSFNLGIEAMQLVVVAAVLPSLLLLSRTRAYSALRIGGAVLACGASAAWLLERTLGVQTPVDRIASVVAGHAPGLAAALFLVCLSFRLLRRASTVRPVDSAHHGGPQRPLSA